MLDRCFALCGPTGSYQSATRLLRRSDSIFGTLKESRQGTPSMPVLTLTIGIDKASVGPLHRSWSWISGFVLLPSS